MSSVEFLGTKIEAGWFVVLIFVLLYLAYAFVATIYSCLTCQSARKCFKCYCCPFIQCFRMLKYACTGEKPVQGNIYKAVSTEEEV